MFDILYDCLLDARRLYYRPLTYLTQSFLINNSYVYSIYQFIYIFLPIQILCIFFVLLCLKRTVLKCLFFISLVGQTRLLLVEAR